MSSAAIEISTLKIDVLPTIGYAQPEFSLETLSEPFDWSAFAADNILTVFIIFQRK